MCLHREHVEATVFEGIKSKDFFFLENLDPFLLPADR